MLTTKPSKSLKQTAVWVNTLIAFTVICALSIAYMQYHFSIIKADFIERQQTFATLYGNVASQYLKDDEHQQFQERIELLRYYSDVEYMHVYRVMPETQKIVFFSSFNKESNPAIPDKIAQIERLHKPQIINHYVELIQPITLEGELVGYIYLRKSAEYIQELISSLTIWFVVISVIGAGLLTLLNLKLVNRITSPITDISEQIQKITRTKDFSQQIADIGIEELNILARNINLLLTRVNKHNIVQRDAEQQILKLNQELEDKVSQRTQALKESNQELVTALEKLHQFQGQLVETEKMASLGDMVAGVAHEVNTPVGLGVTASTLLADRMADIKKAYDEKTLKSSQLNKFLIDGEENISIIYRNLKRAADLISSFKQVAVDQSSQDNRVFAVDELVHEVMLTLAPQLKKTLHKINVDCPPRLFVESKPGPINQILINLIMNSLIHGFENKTNGTIDINIMMLSNQLHVSYKDNGKGVDENIRNKIFDPFITTKRGAGGSGLGLHLVYNLVTQALGGSIYFDSEINQGVTFDIEFPVIQMETQDTSHSDD